MRLFHFSDDPGIKRFVPRAVRVPSKRAVGGEWLNGPLVWAIDEWHQPMYLFPRECPRILLWPLPETTEADRIKWFGDSHSRMLAHIEEAWLERLERETVYRYELPVESFEDLGDSGQWVSREAVIPLRIEALGGLPTELALRDVELRVLPRLTPLKKVWESGLHASGIRLRNAQDWE